MTENDRTVCYTRDGLIVFSLYVTEISFEKSPKDVKEYFLTFGEVISVTYSETSGNYSAYVNFAKAEHAAKALLQSNHCSFSKEILVQPADMWHQPESSFEFSLNLLDLNDDCLLKILSYLNCTEKLRLSSSCKYFCSLIGSVFQSGEAFNYNDVISNCTIPETTEFLSLSGKYIRRITCGYPIKNYVNYIELLPTYCNDLEEVQFKTLTELSYKCFSRIFRANENMKKLDLNECFFITDRVCAQISQLRKLESLNLSGNWKFTGKHLNKLTNLTDLCLHGSAIQPRFFIELCNSVQLKTLNIVLCNALDETAYQALVDTQTQLETINVSDADHGKIKIIAQIKSVKHVHIMYNSDTDLIGELVEHKRDTLESLTLHGYQLQEITQDRILQLRNLKKLAFFSVFESDCVGNKFLLRIARHFPDLTEFVCPGAVFKDSDLINLVGNSKKLEKINVSEWNLSESLYDQLIQVLKEKNVQPIKPYKLCVYGTAINKNIVKTEKYQENAKLLQLCFKDHFENQIK